MLTTEIKMCQARIVKEEKNIWKIIIIKKVLVALPVSLVNELEHVCVNNSILIFANI